MVQGNSKLERIEGAQISRGGIFANEPLGFAVVEIGHADDLELALRDLVQQSSACQLKVGIGNEACAHLAGKDGLQLKDGEAGNQISRPRLGKQILDLGAAHFSAW